MGAEATAKGLPPLGLADVLEQTLLIARKEPRQHPRVAACWLLRYLADGQTVFLGRSAPASTKAPLYACLTSAKHSSDRRGNAQIDTKGARCEN